ncbi:MAG: chlorophyll synthase ChlG [Myxococcota bacterium]
MQHATSAPLETPRSLPSLSASIEVLHPITWFPPMWALACGFVSAGVPFLERWPFVIGAIFLAGPLLCGTSQVVNDWFDRHVDAINEPDRPIPSGRVPGAWGLIIAIVWTVVSLTVAWFLGRWIFLASLLGMFLAWAYSAPPFRLKKNGWFGNAAVGLCYEGLPWFTGTAALTAALPDYRVLLLALLYSVGTFGIMVTNDFKAIEGDRELGVRTLPVQLGVAAAARLAVSIMIAPQLVVVGLLVSWERPIHAAIVAAFVIIQIGLVPKLLRAPRDNAAWFNATGTTLSVLGMMVCALAVRTIGG